MAGYIIHTSHSEFLVIDLVVKQGRSVFDFRIHVNPHDDVITTFEGMCKTMGWFESFASVYFVYLSPEDAVKALVANFFDPVDHDVRVTKSNSGKGPFTIRRIAISRYYVECLADLQWPAGCSISAQ